MVSFSVAAKRAEPGEEEGVVSVPIDGVDYVARRPTTGQVALLTVAQRRGDSFGEAVMNMITAMLGTEARVHIERLIWERRISFEDLMSGTDENPTGLIPAIIEEFSGERPTPPSTDSSSSQTTGGRKSTGRSPGKGSTRSSSPSTDS